MRRPFKIDHAFHGPNITSYGHILHIPPPNHALNTQLSYLKEIKSRGLFYSREFIVGESLLSLYRHYTLSSPSSPCFTFETFLLQSDGMPTLHQRQCIIIFSFSRSLPCLPRAALILLRYNKYSSWISFEESLSRPGIIRATSWVRRYSSSFEFCGQLGTRPYAPIQE